MIMCPYCLTMQEPQQTHLCNNPDCGRKLPSKYVEYARQVYLNDGEIPQIVSGFLDHLATIRMSRL